MKTLKIKPAMTFLFSLLLTGNAFNQAASYPDGSVVADFEVTDIEGTTYTLDEMIGSGRYVLIEFMATECEVCQPPSAVFNEMYDEYGCNNHDVFLISVGTEPMDDNAACAEYNELYGGDFNYSPIVPSEDGDNTSGNDLRLAFGVSFVPTFCLISPEKVMVQNDIWPVTTVTSLLSAFPADGLPAEASCSDDASIGEETADISLSIYPNPSSDQLNVQYKALRTQDVNIEVINLLGEVVLSENYSQKMGSNLTTLDISTIEAGQYVIRINENEKTSRSLFQKTN